MANTDTFVNNVRMSKAVFTKDELYVIERDADATTAKIRLNMYKIARLLCITAKSELSDEIKEQIKQGLFDDLSEHNRSLDVYNSIRKKCERLRKKL